MTEAKKLARWSGVLSLPPGQLLLFRQVCLLAAVAGVLSFRYFWPGLLLLAALVLLDAPRFRGGLWPFMLCFALGFGYTAMRAPSPPPQPPWLSEVLSPLEQDGKGQRPATVRLSGLVHEVVPLPDNRLRLLLQETKPVGLESAHAAPYGGLVLWTWHQPEFPLSKGQVVEAEMRLAPIRGFANPGLWSQEEYWADRGAFIRAWSAGAKPKVRIHADSEAAFFTILRGELRQRFLDALRRTASFSFASPFQHGMTVDEAAPGAGFRLSPGAAMLPALFFGDTSFFTQELPDLLARASLSHSLALSGQHLCYVASLGLIFTQCLGMFFPGVYLKIPRPALVLGISLPLAVLYIWLGQAPVSLLRAGLMFFFWTLLLFLRWPKVTLDGLLAAVGVLLLLNPASLFDLSLQLSALSVATIALCLPAVLRLCHALFPLHGKQERPVFSQRHPWAGMLLRGGLGLVLISLCIQVTLAPLTTRAFGVLTPWFPLNLLWLPVLGCWVMPCTFIGFLFSSFSLTTPAALVLWTAALPGDALVALLSFLNNQDLLIAPLVPRPHWVSMAGYWLLCLCLPLLAAGPTRRRFFLCLCALVLVFVSPLYALQRNKNTEVRLRLLDVGQGQSALIEWSNLGPEKASGRALIDGGGFAGSSFDPGKAIISPVLTDNALPQVDVVLNSHPDVDHLGGLLYILDNFSIGQFLGNGDAPEPALAARLEAIKNRRNIREKVVFKGDSIALAPGLVLEILWPPARQRKNNPEPISKEKGKRGRNNASLIVRLLWQETALALIPGDAEQPALRDFLCSGKDPAAQVLVLPHHGAAGANLPAFVRAVKPDTALAATGFANRWGFPARVTHDTLEGLGIPLYSTARCGQITLRWPSPGQTPAMETARGCP